MIFRRFNFQKLAAAFLVCFMVFNATISAQFVNFLGHETALNMAEAPDETIWVNAGDGLLHYDLNGNLLEVVDKAVAGNLSTPLNTGSEITVAPNGDIWTSSSYGAINRYDGNTWTIFDNQNTPVPFESGSIQKIVAGPDGIIYTFNQNVVSLYENNTWQSYNLGIFTNGMNAAGFSPSGELTLALGKGLATWTVDFGLEFIVEGGTGFGEDAYDFQYLDNGDLYYSTRNKQIYRIPAGSTTPVLIATTDAFFPRLAVTSDGTIWVGTFAQGSNVVQRWTGNSWFTYDSGNSTVSTTPVTDLFADADDNIFLAQGNFNQDEGLQRFDGSNWEVKYNGLITRGDNVNENDFDDAGNLYTIGGKQLISKFNPATGDLQYFHRANSPFRGTVQLLSLAATGDGQIWAGTQNNGIYFYDGSNWTNYTTANTNGQIPVNNIETIKVAPDGTVYALAKGFSPSQKWLVRYQPGTQSWNNYTEGIDLPEDVNNLYVDTEGTAWVSSFNGLAKLENNVVTIFTTDNSDLVDNYTDYIAGRPDGSEILFRGRKSGGGVGMFTFDGQSVEVYGSETFFGQGLGGTFSPGGDYFYPGDLFGGGGNFSRHNGTEVFTYNSNSSFILRSGGGGLLSDPTSGVWYFNGIGVNRYSGEDVNALTIELTSTDVSCHDANDGSLTVSITGGQPPYEVSFGGEILMGSQFTFDNLGEGIFYLVSVVDAEGVTTSDFIRMLNPAPINPNIVVNGNSISSTPTGGIMPYSYLWSNGATGSSINNATPGSYTVTITDSNGCTVIGSGSISNTTVNYCESEGDQPWQSWINTVFLGNINNSSGKSKYSDFTGQTSTVLRAGFTQEITLVSQWSFFTWDLYWRVWIDYNQNGIFEDSEVAAQTILNAPAPGAGPTAAFANITVPDAATLGATRMRVSMKQGAYADPCETFAVGEVEDYTVVIEAGTNGPVCPLTGSAENFTCDDNGTPNNPGDDLYYFDVTITSTSPNPNSMWRYENNNYSYNVPVNLGPFPIAEGNEILFIRDINSTSGNSCELFFMVELPIGPCSDGTPPPPSDDCENNLLTNAGFENGLMDWLVRGNASTTSSNVRTGDGAAELGSGSNRLYRSFSTTAGNTFNLKAYLRSGSGSKNAGISIKYMSSSYQPILNETDYFSAGSTYTLFEKTETAPANTAFIEISIRGFGEGTLIADDICLTNGNVTPPAGNPDLQVSFAGGNYNADPGAVANFNFDLTNAGTVTVEDDYRIGFVLSNDTVFSPDDVLIGEVPTGNTGIGTIANVPGAIRIPAGTDAGSYFLIAVADYDEVVTESNENNNTAVRTFTVNGTITPPPSGEPNCEAESDFPWHEWVSEVTVNEVSKSSSKSVYSDFTSTQFSLGKDGNNNISLTAKYSYVTADAYWRVWVDYNQNDIYEADEVLFEQIVAAPANGSDVTSVAQGSNISIPVSALNGSTKMRVIVSRDVFAEACGTIAFGEVEDYTVLIGASSANLNEEQHTFITDPQLVSLTPNPATDQVEIGLSKMEGQDFELMISNQLGQVLLHQSFEANGADIFTYDTSALPTGVYFVWLKAAGKRSVPQKLIKQRL